MTPQRGAIPLELDGKQRTIFFDAAATALLVDRYGVGFAAELYTVDEADGKVLSLRLKSVEVLAYFLWAGLQAEARGNGETLTFDGAREYIRPWALTAIFSAVLDALTGALYVPQVKAGNAPAAEIPATPAATPTPSLKQQPKKVSTLRTRSGLRSQR